MSFKDVNKNKMRAKENIMINIFISFYLILISENRFNHEMHFLFFSCY